MFRAFVKRSFDRAHEKSMVEKINNLCNQLDPIAKVPNEHQRIFAAFQRLGGYDYINFILISAADIKTSEGVEIKFTSDNDEFTLLSESVDVSSNYSDNLGLGITQFESDLSQEFKDFVNQNEIKTVAVHSEKNQVIIKEEKLVYFQWVDNELLRKVVNHQPELPKT